MKRQKFSIRLDYPTKEEETSYRAFHGDALTTHIAALFQIYFWQKARDISRIFNLDETEVSQNTNSYWLVCSKHLIWNKEVLTTKNEYLLIKVPSELVGS